MKIRSVTIFSGRADAPTPAGIERAGRAAACVRRRLVDAGFEVQTTRLALAPAYRWMPAIDLSASIATAREIEARANAAGIDYISLGPVAAESAHVDELRKLPELIAQTQAIFATALISASGRINTWALSPVAQAVKGIAAATENGFGNLRFAALAECGAGTPFFPVAYAADDDFSCALAMECADLAQAATLNQAVAQEAMHELSTTIETQAARIETALSGVENECGARFNGCDWSLAPHPDSACSIGAAIEQLSGVPFGEWGTLGAVARLTQAIRTANVRHVGFSGVFLPLIEDAVLAQRTLALGDVQKLLLYCSVCGSGLDTVPLAGDVSAEALAAVLGDVATLATSLKKPLTARLMPIPGMQSGERTRFDFSYVVNGHTLALNGAPRP